jgi:copper chaperone CopZ
MKLRLQITGMNCEHCVRRVEEALRTVPGAGGCTVRIGSATIELDDSSVPTSAFIQAIRGAGDYDVPGFERTD